MSRRKRQRPDKRAFRPDPDPLPPEFWADQRQQNQQPHKEQR